MSNTLKMRIGVDFDNTVVSYEGLFYKAAVDQDLIPSSLAPSKGVIRDYLRKIGKEESWTKLQGTVYGTKMDLAFPYPGVLSFFSDCERRNIPLCIISHKTKTPFLGPAYNLHQSARKWIKDRPFSPFLPLFFELTLKEKLDRISQEKCTIFIDDLPEVLQHPDFPKGVEKILFDPHHLYSPIPNGAYADSWSEIKEIINI